MKLSPYDPKQDGKCDVAVCRNLAFINISQFAPIDTVVQNDLAEIGIQIVPRDLSVTTAFTALFTIKDREPMSALGGGYADYTGTYSFAQPNFGSTALVRAGGLLQLLAGRPDQGPRRRSTRCPTRPAGCPASTTRSASCEAMTPARRGTHAGRRWTRT